MQNPAIKVAVSAQPGEKCKTDLKNVKSVKPDCFLQKTAKYSCVWSLGLVGSSLLPQTGATELPGGTKTMPLIIHQTRICFFSQRKAKFVCLRSRTECQEYQENGMNLRQEMGRRYLRYLFLSLDMTAGTQSLLLVKKKINETFFL